MFETETSWRRNSAVFDEKAEEYDSWYDDSLLFDIELTALKEVQTSLVGPKLELGVGPGRFAQELNTDYGIDPAFSPLLLSKSRKIKVLQAIGEELPIAPHSIGSLYMLFTLCFVNDPQRVLAECHRVLQPGGHFVLGMVPVQGAWGRALNAKKEKGHPFYRYASFYSVQQVVQWLEETQYEVVESRVSLFQEPENLREMEFSRVGQDESAGFCLLVARKDAA